MYKLAIFDFDGTLVDSTPGIIDVMRDVVKEYNFDEEIIEEWQHLVGVPLPKQMEIIFPDNDAAFHLEVANRYRAIYDTKAIEICPPFPHMADLLKNLKNAGVVVTIASSKRSNLVQVVIDHHNLNEYFAMVVGAQEVTNHKPHPESVHITVEKLAMTHDDAVVIGDSIFDLDMAKNAGVDAIGVTTGVHTKAMLERSAPTHIVSDLQEVERLILKGKNGKGSAY
ncbi:MAG: HAD family hydrolase [Candidatus Obscuribacter sp.]|nr:HAD family hydrolase [Candidatus Obscuribacter sp.]MDQ5965734.1 family hydrolase [Cyanobacteriota bacterium erpe_2018_sw_39hr_WHONDRS-SW48-000098_B_bin.30]MBK9205813.1 HAD family hydrolase [Candidatus Obscuribacter sp.]MBK9617760.1 HAD family hydrolase [Candidatus Obscuribacter sp.]MBK9773301.1 HAD family hydrolase [Candidatus Obscuribacter sp.]